MLGFSPCSGSARGLIQSDDAEFRTESACRQFRAGGTADRCDGERIPQHGPFAGDAIHLGRLELGVPAETRGGGRLIVGVNEDDIGLLREERTRNEGQGGQQHRDGNLKTH